MIDRVNSNSSMSPNGLLILLLFITLTLAIGQQQPIDDALVGLTLDELEMLEDFELKLLRDFVKTRGKGSVSKASNDEGIDLSKLNLPKVQIPENMTGLVDLGVSSASNMTCHSHILCLLSGSNANQSFADRDALRL